MIDIQLSQIMPTEERIRCAEIALDIWKKKPAKYAEWYKRVGREIAAEIMGVDLIGPFGIRVVLDETLAEGEVKLRAQSYEDLLKKRNPIKWRRKWEGNWS